MHLNAVPNLGLALDVSPVFDPDMLTGNLPLVLADSFNTADNLVPFNFDQLSQYRAVGLGDTVDLDEEVEHCCHGRLAWAPWLCLSVTVNAGRTLRQRLKTARE